jgi:zinc transport system substrate-binding protein
MIKMTMKKVLSAALCLSLMLSIPLITGCSKENTNETDKIIIAVSVVPQKTFVEAVCGDLVQVVTMIPPGSSPENYEPTPIEMEQFSKAALYFSIGVAAEAANILPNVGDTAVISLAEKVAAAYPDRTFESGERDPHIWLSPIRVKVMVETIADEMSKLDPVNTNVYEKNAQAFIQKLDELDEQIQSALSGMQNKKFIVYHPAFGYLAEDYGLTMYALEEEGKEATPQNLQGMIDLAKAENIKVIFYQEEIDSSQSEAFAEEIGGKTVQLAPLAANYIENLKNMAATMAEAMR